MQERRDEDADADAEDADDAKINWKILQSWRGRITKQAAGSRQQESVRCRNEVAVEPLELDH